MLWWPGFRRRLLSDRRKLGTWGESRCRRYLKSRGYRTLARNYSCRTGELDLVMEDGGKVIVFVEVKTRSDESFAPAQDSVTPAKRQKMIRTARYFAKANGIKDRPLRFDVVAVCLPQKGKPQIRHYENAFTP